MSPSEYEFQYNPNLPSDEKIVAYCLGLGFRRRGTPIVDPSTSSVIAWIKYGPSVTIDEARTQHWTSNALCKAGVLEIQVAPVFRAFTAEHKGVPIGYIAMEYIDGTDCDSNDVDVVAKAVQELTRLRAPSLGHVGGGGAKSIIHPFFPEWRPNANYRTNQDFYDHIHNIFTVLRIDFSGDISSHDPILCPSDVNPGNFRKRTMDGGRSVVVAFDFRATCFMPLPFLEVALRISRDSFHQSVFQKIYPQGPSDVANCLLSASSALVQYGVKPIALPPGVSSTIKSR